MAVERMDFGGGPVIRALPYEEPSYADSLFNIWSDMGSTVGNVWDETKETVSNTIDTVASAPSRAWTAVKENAKEALTTVSSGVGDAFSWLSGKVLMIIGGVLLILIILAKTGVIPQVADLMRSFSGV